MNFYDLHEEVAEAVDDEYFWDTEPDDGSFDVAVADLAKSYDVDWSVVDFLVRSIIDYQGDWLYERTVEEVREMLTDNYFDEHSFEEAADDISDKLSDQYSLAKISAKVVEAIVDAETEDDDED